MSFSPITTVPSTGTRSPGPDQHEVANRTCSIGTCRTSPASSGRITVAVSGLSSISERTARWVRSSAACSSAFEVEKSASSTAPSPQAPTVAAPIAAVTISRSTLTLPLKRSRIASNGAKGAAGEVGADVERDDHPVRRGGEVIERDARSAAAPSRRRRRPRAATAPTRSPARRAAVSPAVRPVRRG